MLKKRFPGPLLSLLALAVGCHGSSSKDTSPTDDTQGATAPTILSNTPLADAADVLLNERVSATFSEEMNGSSLDMGDAFVVESGDPPVEVAGTVVYADSTATFWPSAHFGSGTHYTARISATAESALGVPLEEAHVWSFTTGATLGPGMPVPLGAAGEFAILAKTGISSVPTSAVTGDIGVSPAAATYITGFSLIADASNEFATSSQVTGKAYASDYSPPTPSYLTGAIGDMQTAFTDAAGRAPDQIELGAGNIGGLDLAPGVYKWGTGVLIPTDVTLTGEATDVWIFEIAQDLSLASAASVNLAGGAAPQNVFWQVSGAVELGTTSHLEGVVLTQTSVTLRTGASINGRLLAQTAVDLDAGSVTEPAQ